MNCKLELEQKKEEINGIVLQAYHESSSQLVNGHNTQLSGVALSYLTPSAKHGNSDSSRDPVSEQQAWDLKRLVLIEKIKWRTKSLALLAN